MGGCPFCELPPSTEVLVDYNGIKLPRTAQMLCDDWHFAKAIEPVMARANESLLKRLDEASRFGNTG